MNAGDNEAFEKCIYFLKEIGINIVFKEINTEMLLPGFEIEKGILYINRAAVKYPGDVLHEAGHIAVVPTSEREALFNDTIDKRTNREAEEMMAIAWSYAACLHLGIDPDFVFHDEGYKGGGSYITTAFNNKQYFGLPMLQWIGLCVDEERGKTENLLPYPHMLKWMRD